MTHKRGKYYIQRGDAVLTREQLHNMKSKALSMGHEAYLELDQRGLLWGPQDILTVYSKVDQSGEDFLKSFYAVILKAKDEKDVSQGE